jgi:hypothetical protein
MAYFDLNKAPIRAAWPAHPCVIWFCVLVGSAIFALHILGRPPNVAGLIIAVVINSINGMVRWSFADISQEVFKFMPAGTNLDATSAIVFVADGVWVLASREHAPPCSIERMKVSDSGEAVGQVADLAAAGTDLAFSQASSRRELDVSAVALATPHDVSSGISAGGWFERDQSIKPLILGNCAPHTSARERGAVVTLKTAFKDDAFLTAIALANPSALSGRLDRSQSSEPHICDIDKLAHRTASDGLREVTGSMLEALVPLRIIARQ